MTSRRRCRSLWGAAAAVLVAGAAVALWWFTPWKLWTNHRVKDALPAVALTDNATASHAASAAPSLVHAAEPRALLRGTFISHEHPTRGSATVVLQPDGSRVLALANLRTSDGPVLKVWLTDQPVTKSGLHVFDDGRYIDLGRLKGNIGNQLYPIPAGAELTGIRSVSIWCDRFDVSFGAAALT
jgi:hypothetical protein